MGRLKQPPETSTYTFVNLNPKGRRTGDCVVRAIAFATSQSWDDTFDGLVALAKKMRSMPDCIDVFDKYLQSLGWVKMPAPRKDGNHRYTGKEFVKVFEGVAVANIGGHHLTAIADHKIVDIWDCSNGSIGNYWVFKGVNK